MPKHLEQISTHVLGPFFFFFIKGDDLLSILNVFCFKKKINDDLFSFLNFDHHYGGGKFTFDFIWSKNSFSHNNLV